MRLMETIQTGTGKLLWQVVHSSQRRGCMQNCGFTVRVYCMCDVRPWWYTGHSVEQEEHCKRVCIPPIPTGMITIWTASARNRKLATLSLGVRLSGVKTLACNISVELELLPLINTHYSGFVNLSAEWCCFFREKTSGYIVLTLTEQHT